MPKTDINDDRSLRRLQGIDLRESADSNTAFDCVNIHLNNGSRMTNFPPPTKVASGAYTFACESKDPSGTEFTLSLNGHFGAPAVTGQYSHSDGLQTRLAGSNLVGNTTVILTDEDGHCLISGLDFDISRYNDDLVLDILWSDYANYEKVVIKNAYGWASFDVDVVERLNNVLYFGNTFKVGIDNQTLSFCIWKHSQSNGWERIQSWKNNSAKQWTESANRKVNVDFFALQDSNHAYAFMPSTSTTNQALTLRYSFNADSLDTWERFMNFSLPIQSFGNATTGYTPEWQSAFQATEFRYDFGQYASYRLLIDGSTLKLLSKSDYESDEYDTTLQEWTYEQ